MWGAGQGVLCPRADVHRDGVMRPLGSSRQQPWPHRLHSTTRPLPGTRGLTGELGTSTSTLRVRKRHLRQRDRLLEAPSWGVAGVPRTGRVGPRTPSSPDFSSVCPGCMQWCSLSVPGPWLLVYVVLCGQRSVPRRREVTGGQAGRWQCSASRSPCPVVLLTSSVIWAHFMLSVGLSFHICTLEAEASRPCRALPLCRDRWESKCSPLRLVGRPGLPPSRSRRPVLRSERPRPPLATSWRPPAPSGNSPGTARLGRAPGTRTACGIGQRLA